MAATKHEQPICVIPAKAGIQFCEFRLDSRFRGNDKQSNAALSKSGFTLKLLPRRCAPGRGGQAPPASRTKLPQVMIHVQVAPAEPLPLRKLSKNRMRLKLKISLPGCEAFDESKQLRDVLLKVQRTGTNIPFLIDFRWRLKPLRPLQWGPECDPLDHRLVDEVGCQAGRLLANGNSKCIAEMTDHLM